MQTKLSKTTSACKPVGFLPAAFVKEAHVMLANVMRELLPALSVIRPTNSRTIQVPGCFHIEGSCSLLPVCARIDCGFTCFPGSVRLPRATDKLALQ